MNIKTPAGRTKRIGFLEKRHLDTDALLTAEQAKRPLNEAEIKRLKRTKLSCKDEIARLKVMDAVVMAAEPVPVFDTMTETAMLGAMAMSASGFPAGMMDAAANDTEADTLAYFGMTAAKPALQQVVAQ